MRHFPSALILACAVALSLPASAQVYNGKRLVETSLIADTNKIVPGKPFTAGLLLKMAPGWHTYWQYPGDAGMPTKIDWKLPPGFHAGAIQWPLPEKVVEEGDLVTYAYKDEVLLLVEIRPPANLDAKQVTLSGKASWLVCEKLCVPGDADLSLTLPVAAQSQPANGEIFAKYRALMPKTDSAPFTYHWNSRPDLALLELRWPKGRDMLRQVSFYPLPPPSLILDHPEFTLDGRGQPGIQAKVTSGSPDQLAGVLVMEAAGNNPRESWFIPSAATPQNPPVEKTGSSNTFTPQHSAADLLRYLIFGFFGGMILNIMPCVLPVITLKIYGFIQQAGQSRKRTLELGLAYCAGVFAWFLGLAALIVIFGLNWSFQFQNKGFVLGMLILCVLFGLNLLGLFEVMIPGGLNTRLATLASKEGLGGAFVHGLFATLLGSACTAPLLGPAIGFALAQTPVIIFSFFATIAAGMALPYFLLTLNPGWMRFLPKPGMWMVRVKQVMGVLVLATAIWFGEVLYQQVAVKRAAFAPMLEKALKSSQTVFVDFTAEWCVNCKFNEKAVLKSADVQAAFKKDDILFLKADWTTGDPDITKLLKQFGRAGVPAYVIYPAASHDQPIVLPELLTRQIVLDGLNEAKKKSSKQ